MLVGCAAKSKRFCEPGVRRWRRCVDKDKKLMLALEMGAWYMMILFFGIVNEARCFAQNCEFYSRIMFLSVRSVIPYRSFARVCRSFCQGAAKMSASALALQCLRRLRFQRRLVRQRFEKASLQMRHVAPRVSKSAAFCVCELIV